MTRSRTGKPAVTFRTRGGDVVSTGAQAASSAAPALPEWHTAALLVAYRIATYQPRTREAWRAALDEAGLGAEARAVAAEYLQDRWTAEPMEPPPKPYGEGAVRRGVFAAAVSSAPPK